MSLEEALNANTKAVQEHTAQLKLMLSGAKPAGKPTMPNDKPAASGTKAASTPAKTTTTKKKAETTAEDVAAKVTAFLKVGDKALRDQRKEEVKTIIDHYGADRFTNIDPASFDEALGFLAAYEAGEVPDFGDGDGDDGDGGEDDDMV